MPNSSLASQLRTPFTAPQVLLHRTRHNRGEVILHLSTAPRLSNLMQIQGDGLNAENARESSNQMLPVEVSCFDGLAPLQLGSPYAVAFPSR